MTDKHMGIRPTRVLRTLRTPVWKVLPDTQYTSLQRLGQALRKEAKTK